MVWVGVLPWAGWFGNARSGYCPCRPPGPGPAPLPPALSPHPLPSIAIQTLRASPRLSPSEPGPLPHRHRPPAWTMGPRPRHDGRRAAGRRSAWNSRGLVSAGVSACRSCEGRRGAEGGLHRRLGRSHACACHFARGRQAPARRPAAVLAALPLLSARTTPGPRASHSIQAQRRHPSACWRHAWIRAGLDRVGMVMGGQPLPPGR